VNIGNVYAAQGFTVRDINGSKYLNDPNKCQVTLVNHVGACIVTLTTCEAKDVLNHCGFTSEVGTEDEVERARRLA